MAKHNITLIPGDGVGPEISEVMCRCVEATGFDVAWEVAEAGEKVMKSEGTPLPKSALNSIRKNRVAIKGPVTTPVGGGFRSVNVTLRKELDLYACLRPCKTYRGVRGTRLEADLVIVRENSEDLYAGIEYFRGSEQCAEIEKTIERLDPGKLPPKPAISIKPISAQASERITRFAFEYAVKNGRRKVTASHKANIMKATDGLFLESARAVAGEYAGRVEFDDRIVDNLCMQLVQRPAEYDVIVLPNLYGDIVSDLCAGLVGGLGMAPGANIGDGIAVFESTHGSAPKYTGKNKINPTALILSGAMMLRYVGEAAKADRLEAAVAAVIGEGKSVTYDFKERRDDPSAVGTRQMAEAIIAKIESRN